MSDLLQPRMLTVASYNAGNGSAEDVARDMSELDELCDVYGLQEMGDRIIGRRRHYQGTGKPGQDSTPIVYNGDTMLLKGSGSYALTPETEVGERGAGPSVLKAKWANWIKLQHKATGRMVYFANYHAVPTVELSGSRLNTNNPERLALYRQQMARLVALLRRKPKRRVFILVGDFNAQPGFPYLLTLKDAGLRSTYDTFGTDDIVPSHGNRRIDAIYYRRTDKLEPQNHETLDSFSSDHRPIVARFLMKKRRRWVFNG